MRKIGVALVFAAAFATMAAETPKPHFFFNSAAGQFQKSVPITINCASDFSGAKEELQIILQQRGWQIYSAIAERTATTGYGNRVQTVEQGAGYSSINTLDQSQRQYTQENRNYGQQTYKAYGTEYLITPRYALLLDKNGAPYVKNGRMYFTAFSAEIASKTTGEILMSIQYPYFANGYEKTALLQNLVDRMSLCAEQGKCDEASQEPPRKDNSGAAVVLLLVGAVLAVALIAAND